MAEILLAASVEMGEAAAWYDERVSGLGERFLGGAEAAFARIDETPLAGSPWTHRRLPDGVRRMLQRFASAANTSAFASAVSTTSDSS